MKTQPKAFVGKSGQFYILRNEGIEINPTYMRRSSIEAYNNREGYPDIVSSAEALADFEKEVTIDQIELKVLVE